MKHFYLTSTSLASILLYFTIIQLWFKPHYIMYLFNIIIFFLFLV